MIEYQGKQYKRVVSNFSCGAASAVATKFAILEFGKENVFPVYQVTNSEHPDNERFLRDCEEWFGVKIERQQSSKYNDIYEVFEARRYLAGVKGAPCTSELKRRVAEENIDWFNDLEVFGYTVEELDRVNKFIKNNEERRIYPILTIGNGVSKNDCYSILVEAGIELPMMYKLGYRNNNCIGCVKGQQGYWNKIRKDFPEHFEKTSLLERKFNAAINKRYKMYNKATDAEKEQFWLEASDEAKDKARKKLAEGKIPNLRLRVFLDELNPKAGNYKSEPSISCGTMCEK